MKNKNVSKILTLIVLFSVILGLFPLRQVGAASFDSDIFFNRNSQEQKFEREHKPFSVTIKNLPKGKASFIVYAYAEECGERTILDYSDVVSVNVKNGITKKGYKDGIDYSAVENWAYFEEGENKDADLFLIAPTVDTKDEYNMSMSDEKTKNSFLGALNMERGIYDENTRMFAPYYRQGAMKIYSMTPEEREPYLQYAYADVAEAFEYYLKNENNGRPIVLAGFSQGADMCYRLLKDYFGDEEMQKKLIAAYAIGWPCTKAMVKKFPQIKPAKGETDTGVVISFDCESPKVTETFITPKGMKAYTINPLNWKTDATPADKSENIGACFTDYGANIKSEVKGLCGCYIDKKRGVVKVTDVDADDYPAYVAGLPEGAYHIYDYQFFFRNLQENVGKRVKSYLSTGNK